MIGSSLRELARQSTAAAHSALENTPLMRVISEGVPTGIQYRAYLSLQMRLHGPLEAALRPWVPADWRERRLLKTRWLRSDIETLGLMPDSTPADGPHITSTAEPLGVLYVLEGGTLGLQVVRKRMHLDDPTCAAATRFMAGYGADTDPNWRAFLECLEDLPTHTWPHALDAACDTFAAFQRQFSRSTP
ncbi:MAG: biliverdin-producing heme oxygenase [Chitinophagaceae bacterium]|nr:biliverdin-producing heme oxygenase [Rubrivivax sp.]